MKNQAMSCRQATCLMVLFLFGNSAMFGINGCAGRDSWAALLLAGAGALLVTTLLYARILHLCPGQNFFDMLYSLFGKFVGSILCIFFVWYALHITALLIRMLTEFGMLNSLPEPPYYLVLILFVVVGIYLLRSGESVLGRWSVIIFAVALGITIFIIAAATPKMDPFNLLPVFRRPAGEIFRGAARYLSFPFLECVIFIPLFCGHAQRTHAGKIFSRSIFWSTGILLCFLLCNLLLLGEPILSQLYFPSHSAAKLIYIGRFLTRLEEVISVFMLLSGLAKLVVCLQVSSKGLASLCGSKNSGEFIVPAALFSFALSIVVVNNMMDMNNFLSIYPVYASIFQLLLPLVIWGALEYKMFKKRGTSPEKK